MNAKKYYFSKFVYWAILRATTQFFFLQIWFSLDYSLFLSRMTGFTLMRLYNACGQILCIVPKFKTWIKMKR